MAKQIAEKLFPIMIKEFKNEIKMALPSHVDTDRTIRAAITAFKQNPKLANCNPVSVCAAVVQAAQLGLHIGVMGQAYLVPYGKTCQFIPGWRGYVGLINRSRDAQVWTGAVFLNDEFNYRLGDNPSIDHVPMGLYKSKDLQYVYAIGRIKDHDYPIIEVWSMDRVLEHRDQYNKVGKSHYSIVNDGQNLEMYARKVVLMQVIKYLPMSTELSQATQLDYAAERGKQNVTWEQAVGNTWEAEPYSDDSLQANQTAMPTEK